MDDLQFLPSIRMKTVIDLNRGTIGILKCCSTTTGRRHDFSFWTIRDRRFPIVCALEVSEEKPCEETVRLGMQPFQCALRFLTTRCYSHLAGPPDSTCGIRVSPRDLAGRGDACGLFQFALLHLAAGAALFFRAGTLVDDAMTAIERNNSSLKGVCGDSPHSRFGHPGRSCARHPRTR
jgi:hypothetical protein